MRLVLVGGGTAGHIFPTIAVARQLATLTGSAADLTAVCGSRELDRLLYRDVELEVIPLPARGIVGVAWWRLPWRGWLLMQSLLTVWRDFSKRRPDAVIASGGYVSAPVLLVSWLRRIPSVIFSGDAALGWATRVMAPLTSVATIAFEEARSQIWRTPVELTGYPLRASFAAPDASAARAVLGVPGDHALIVVMGGSQGAHAINEALRVDLKRLLEVAHVVHVSGQRDFQPLTVERDRLPAALRTRYHLHDFIHQGFADLLAAADIVVSRAGATSVAELSAVGTAAVLIPGAFGAGHQIATAEAMARAEAAMLLPESDLASGRLVDVLLGALTDPGRLRALSAASRSRGRPHAATRIARIGLDLAGQPNDSRRMMSPEITHPASRHVHIVGIGGKGMSAIGAALLDLGKTVSGSDLKRSSQADRLQTRGARIALGHNAAHIAGADIVIHSSAIASDNPELAAARCDGVPVSTRAEAVAALFNARRGIAVAGTHGKTTTSAMTATILHGAGLAPSFLIGADIPSLGGENGRIGTGTWMVLEADEFDDAFLAYQPRVAVLTHLEADHLDHFGSVDRMVAAFEQFVDQLPANTTLVARRDVALLRQVAERHAGDLIWFGPGGDWRIEHYRSGTPGPTLDISSPGGQLVLNLPVPGHHNALNALAALAAATLAGVDATEAARALEGYSGAERRLQLRANTCGVSLYEDYAHHPTAVRASLQAVRELNPRRVLAVYQPLLQSRTRDLFEDFLDAFGDADLVWLADIYSPPGREAPIGISSADLASAVRHPNAMALSTSDAIAERVLAEARAGDLILVMGPESITPLADRLATSIAQRTEA